jgi:uncharacterized membrane protein (DUF373 family)
VPSEPGLPPPDAPDPQPELNKAVVIGAIVILGAIALALSVNDPNFGAAIAVVLVVGVARLVYWLVKRTRHRHGGLPE